MQKLSSQPAPGRRPYLAPSPAAATLVSLALVGGVALLLLVVAVGYRSTGAGLYALGGILAIGLAGAIFLKPELGAYVLVFTVVSNVSTVVTDHGYPSVNKPLVALVFLSLLASRLLKGQRLFKFSRVEWLMLAYTFVLFLSAFVARDRAAALDLAIEFSKDFVIFICVVAALESKEAFARAGWLALATAAALAAVGVYQAATGQYDRTFFGFALVESGFEGYDLFSGRITGPLGDPNFFGQVLVAFLPLGLYRLWGARRWLLKGAAAGISWLILFAIMNTYSRGAFLALLLVMGLIALERRVRLQMVLALGLLAVVGLQFVPAGYSERLSSIVALGSGGSASVAGEESFRGRASEALSGLYMFAEHPLLGVGGGNYEVNYQRYASRVGLEQRAQPRRAHSLYIEAAAETGLLGLIPFLGIFATVLLWLNRARQKARRLGSDPGWQAWLASVQVGIVGYLTTSLLLHNSFVRYLWLLLALGTAAVRLTEETGADAHDAA